METCYGYSLEAPLQGACTKLSPHLGHTKQISAFEHVQNAEIQIIPHMRKEPSRAQLFKALLA